MIWYTIIYHRGDSDASSGGGPLQRRRNGHLRAGEHLCRLWVALSLVYLLFLDRGPRGPISATFTTWYRSEKLVKQPLLSLLRYRTSKFTEKTPYQIPLIVSSKLKRPHSLSPLVNNMPSLKKKKLLERKSEPSHQLAHVVNRMFTTLESKGIVRSTPQEF